MKPGPKAKTEQMKTAAGTTRKDRINLPAFPAREVEGWQEPIQPAWLTPLAAEAWGRKVTEYRLRGQRVRGFEDALAQYCSLEAALINALSQGAAPPVALVKEYRAFACEFYDTPAAQKVSVKEVLKAGNPFMQIAAN